MADAWQNAADHSPLAAPPSGDGTVWQNAADHSPAAPKTDDDIIRSYGYDPAVITKAHLYRQGELKGLMDRPVEMDMTPSDKPGLLSDAAHGFASALLGINQLASHGVSTLTGDPADAQYSDLLTKVARDAYVKIRSDPSKIGELAGSALIPIPGGAAKTVAGMVAKGALTGAAASAAQPVDVSGPGGDYFTPKLKQTAIGAAAGGAASALTGAAARALSSRAVELPEETAARAQTGGTQQVSKLETAMQNTPFAGATDVSKAADAGDRAAIALRDQMTSASTPAEIQQASIGLMNWRTRQTASRLYDNVEQTIAKHPDMGDVPLDKTEQTISDALEQAQKAKDPDMNLVKLLKTVQRNIGASADPVSGDQLVDNSFGQIRKFRSDLGDRIAALRTGAGNQLLGPSSAATLQGVRNAVDEDLRNFTASSAAPDVQRAADIADKYYAQNRVPFGAPDVAKAGAPDLAGTTTAAEPDQIFGKFIQAGRGDKAQRFFDALDPRGRAAVQYQMAADAMNKATNPLRGTFDPETFFNALDKTKEAYGVFFTGPDKAAMDGLKNLARQAVLGADKESALKSKLGSAAIGGGIATEVASRLGAPLPVTGAIGTIPLLASAARGLMLTDAGRRLLADASSMKPGNPDLARILDTISRQFPATAARAATPDQ